MIRITSPRDVLRGRGIDPTKAWADDEGLTKRERAALRALGRREVQRTWEEKGQYLDNPTDHGMSGDGSQK